MSVKKIEEIEVLTSFHDLSLLSSSASVKTYSTKDVVIFAENETIVKGVDNLIVVNLEDLTFIQSTKEKTENKKLYKDVKNENPQKVSVHKTAYRPWGSYTVLEEKDGFKVKRITVKPGKRLSLQYHFHRCENWTVVRGTAKVRLGNKELILKPGDHVYIPKKEVHRLENPGEEVLEVIEVQVGDYLGEDDIVRIEDDFKRI
ncbi:MAG: cupin domain-containing protein [Thermotogaceae bacterium]|nr:cupin domain-containing protein [Thermotogaceae bacterium]